MKKYMEMPEVQVIEFEAKDVIVTSGGDMNGTGKPTRPVQERRSVFED